MKVTNWVDYEEPGYIEIDDVSLEDFISIEECVINDIKTHGYKISGKDYQNGYCPVIDGKYKYAVSMRKWGSVMQRAYNLANGDGLGYVYYAWGYPNDVKPMLPDKLLLS